MSIANIRFGMVKNRNMKRFKQAVEKHEVDEAMVPLCEFVNSRKHFFTSSSCSGRIILLKVSGKTKRDASFHRKWHRTVSFEEVWQGIEKARAKELWFKMEPFIIHIGTDSLKRACKLLDIKNKAGVKRGGIIVAKPGKFLLELVGTEAIALPVKLGGKIIVSKRFLKEVVKKANEKLEANFLRLKKFEEILRADLS